MSYRRGWTNVTLFKTPQPTNAYKHHVSVDGFVVLGFGGMLVDLWKILRWVLEARYTQKIVAIERGSGKTRIEGGIVSSARISEAFEYLCIFRKWTRLDYPDKNSMIGCWLGEYWEDSVCVRVSVLSLQKIRKPVTFLFALRGLKVIGRSYLSLYWKFDLTTNIYTDCVPSQRVYYNYWWSCFYGTQTKGDTGMF